jgi:RNA polymerase sigma-70 factor (ECF subfamily)
MVLDARMDTGTQARAALETLCRLYWYPLYAFVRRHGRTKEEAEDCTQEFLYRLLASSGISRARSDRGRFRTYLLTALTNFLRNEWHKERAEKRGGGCTVLPLSCETAERQFAHEPVDPSLNPQQAFDRNWARCMIDQAIGVLRTEYERTGRGGQFNALLPFVWGAKEGGTRSEQARRAGMDADSFAVALHRLRCRVGERLRAAVAETVADESEIDAELRDLIAAVGRS